MTNKILLIVSWFIAVILGTLLLINEPTYPEISSSDEVIKTVAHVNLDPDKYKRIYTDNEHDIAYWLYTGDINSPHKVGDKVYVKDLTLEIKSVDAHGFTMSYDSSIGVGMSGSSVYDKDGNAIGIISYVKVDHYVYCIWSKGEEE